MSSGRSIDPILFSLLPEDASAAATSPTAISQTLLDKPTTLHCSAARTLYDVIKLLDNIDGIVQT